MRADLPDGLTPYKRTPTFDAETVPAGLRAQHSTKTGVWARVVVLEGSLPFRFLEPDEELVVLTPERPGIVAPTQLHRAEPGPGVRFYVEFHRAGLPLTVPGLPPPSGGA
ncbi:DUF1971 domain-containing protein [Synechococcus sp. CS-1332]|uniref:DUF1971 domain-containing protein n=1 Tax=Synechococcus sp. CS-1332 TaxID=2847972 RepID=UPI00223BF755|nr:DUF1971 domain-containing protein [Synechococcus sp. CS-1332]MCT0207296.1 DUF1971 domain-containing protein [Synechococcus sp. CS-1332]